MDNVGIETAKGGFVNLFGGIRKMATDIVSFPSNFVHYRQIAIGGTFSSSSNLFREYDHRNYKIKIHPSWGGNTTSSVSITKQNVQSSYSMSISPGWNALTTTSAQMYKSIHSSSRDYTVSSSLSNTKLLRLFAIGFLLYGQTIAAAIATRHGEEVDESVLREMCFAAMGEYRSPSHYFFLKELPKGPSEKIQRLKLTERYGKS